MLRKAENYWNPAAQGVDEVQYLSSPSRAPLPRAFITKLSCKILLRRPQIVIISDSMQLEPLPSLADRFRSLLAAVKDACAMQGCRGLLAGPMALLFWICSRRMRQEAAAAFEQFKTLMEQLLVLLEDFRAGKLNGPDVRPAQQTIPAATMTDLSASGLDRRVEPGDDDKELMRQLVEGIAPLRSSASSAANSLLRRKHRASQSPHEPVDHGGKSLRPTDGRHARHCDRGSSTPIRSTGSRCIHVRRIPLNRRNLVF